MHHNHQQNPGRQAKERPAPARESETFLRMSESLAFHARMIPASLDDRTRSQEIPLLPSTCLGPCVQANPAPVSRIQPSGKEEAMNEDNVKGVLQKISGRVEESAGALVGDRNLKEAGQEDQLKGSARAAWGNVKDAGNALIDKARAARYDAEDKSASAEAFDREHDGPDVK